MATPKATVLTPVKEGVRSKPKNMKHILKGSQTPEAPHLRHPWKNRKALSENYDHPVTEREGWWRTYIRETPLPGAYEWDTFLVDLEKRPNTYRFKSDGRKIDPHPHGKGAVLLPGNYNFQHFLERLEKAPATYSFKGEARDKRDFLNMGKKDRDINVSPDAYSTEKYLTLTTDKMPSKHSMFKSQSERFPTKPFKPREGPAPGNYENLPPRTNLVVSSSFKSKTPRFSTSHTRQLQKVPGPGTYAKTYQHPIPQTVSNMGRQHGLFFSSEFQA